MKRSPAAVDRPSRGRPKFHIIPCISLQGTETQEDEPHLKSVLIVSDKLYSSPTVAHSMYPQCHQGSRSYPNQALLTASHTKVGCMLCTLRASSWLKQSRVMPRRSGRGVPARNARETHHQVNYAKRSNTSEKVRSGGIGLGSVKLPNAILI
jgi:hypothetical protein